jgi:lysozyme
VITEHAIDLAKDLITQFEGLALEAYTCPAGKLTIGFGHTGDDVQAGDEITEEIAYALLESDMTEALNCVDSYVAVDVTDTMQAALISFIFNVGCNAFRGSTLLAMLNVEQYDDAAKQFARWNKSKGKVLPGLVRRRKAEENMFRGLA